MRPIHALPVVLVVAALAGCGGGGDDNGDGGSTSGATPAQTQSTTQTRAPDGKTIFTTHTCDGCHTLAAANAIGNVGPNLDDLKPDFATVRNQVKNGGGGMPSYNEELSPAQIDAVARFVADNAGR
jgi:mono/diheme cytochrome c family protein